MHIVWRQKKNIRRQKHMLASIYCLEDHSGALSPQGPVGVQGEFSMAQCSELAKVTPCYCQKLRPLKFSK